MTSCESERRAAYSDELRWRMVWQREGCGFTLDQVASNLNVGLSTVYRITSAFRESGAVSKKKYPTGVKPNVQLTNCVQLYILHYITQKPSIYLWELQLELQKSLGVDVSISSLCRFLRKNNFSRQKLQLVATQRNEEIRAEFVSDASIYQQQMLLFIDETGMDRRDTIRKYGYSVRGHTPRSHKLLYRGKRVSAITVMSCEGILDVQLEHDSVDGETFLKFVEKNLLPLLMPFNGTNPNSIVIMDNAAIHHVEGVVDMVNEIGAIVHFLPPYSPDYAPIEECFSKVKGIMREMEMEAQVDDIETVVLTAFASVTKDDCRGWIGHSGIY